MYTIFTVWGIVTVVGCAILFARPVYETLLTFVGRRIIIQKRRKILAIPDVTRIILGTDKHIVEGKEFYADASVTVLVSREGKLSGLIGIDLMGDTLCVVQLQGLKRANFHGVSAGEYLLTIAEKIARILEVKLILVQAAEYNVYYEWNEKKTHEMNALRRERLERMYNVTARNLEYTRSANRPKWWFKEL